MTKCRQIQLVGLNVSVFVGFGVFLFTQVPVVKSDLKIYFLRYNFLIYSVMVSVRRANFLTIFPELIVIFIQ